MCTASYRQFPESRNEHPNGRNYAADPPFSITPWTLLHRGGCFGLNISHCRFLIPLLNRFGYFPSTLHYEYPATGAENLDDENPFFVFWALVQSSHYCCGCLTVQHISLRPCRSCRVPSRVPRLSTFRPQSRSTAALLVNFCSAASHEYSSHHE